MFNNKNNKKTLIIIGIAKRINTNEIKYNKKRIFQKKKIAIQVYMIVTNYKRKYFTVVKNKKNIYIKTEMSQTPI